MPFPKKDEVALEKLLFRELSYELDHRLDWHALVLAAVERELFSEPGASGELAEILFEYLGRRTALEHVFFGRALRSIRWEKTKLAAEIWRYRKVKARSCLLRARAKKNGTP